MDGRVIDRIMCFRCQKNGHFTDMCPNTELGITQNIIANKIQDTEPDDTESVFGSVHEVKEDAECGNNEWVDLQ